VGIRSRNHQDAIALQAVKAGEDIGREIDPGKVAYM
jgi:hypothetical protein